jgi:molybdopterin molybdotransferase
MISVDQARQIVIDTFRAQKVPLKTERVSLEEALGRVLAQEIVADADQPPFDRSLKDGYAVQSVDLQKGPVELRVVGESRAGASVVPQVSVGEAVQIMTGAAMPAGADAVVMVEETEPIGKTSPAPRVDSFDSKKIRVNKSVKAGVNVSSRGCEAKAGDRLASRGCRLRVQEISLAASVGDSNVEVFRKPRVGIIATGDELVPMDEIPAQNCIRNTNSSSLHALVKKAQAVPRLFGIARDSSDDLQRKIGAALEASDCLLLTGGVSAGKYDFVEPVLKQFGVQFYFDAVSIRPGKPAVFGARDAQFVFALPGNPVSAVVTFHWFVAPLLALLSGEEPPAPPILKARLRNSFKQPLGRRGFLPAYFEIHGGEMMVETVRWKGSSDLAGLSRSNCFLIAPEDQAEFAAGDPVEVLLAD